MNSRPSHLTLVFGITLACGSSVTPSHPPREGEPERVWTNSLLLRVPPEQAHAALPNEFWSKRLKVLYTEGCGEIIDVAKTWSKAHGLPTPEIHDRQSSRYGFFDVFEPSGYFYISADWSRRLHGTAPVAGYLIQVEVTFYSRQRLTNRQRRTLDELGVHELLEGIEASAKSCGWLEIE